MDEHCRCLRYSVGDLHNLQHDGLRQRRYRRTGARPAVAIDHGRSLVIAARFCRSFDQYWAPKQKSRQVGAFAAGAVNGCRQQPWGRSARWRTGRA